MISCEFCKISKNTFFNRTTLVAPFIINVHSHLRNTIYTMLPMYEYILLKKAKKKETYSTWWSRELENWPSVQDIRMMMLNNVMERDVVNIFWQIDSLFIHSLFIFIHSFSCEFCKICKNTFFHRTRPVAASIINVHSHLSNTIYTMLPMYTYILLKKAKKK